MTASAFLAVYLLHLMAAISPGPSVLMAARIGVTEGFKTGAAVAVGIGIGGVLWASAALFGLALLFEYAPMLLTVMKLAGGAFLLFMAYKLWTSADEPLAQSTQNSVPRSLGSAFFTWVGHTDFKPKTCHPVFGNFHWHGASQRRIWHLRRAALHSFL